MTQYSLALLDRPRPSYRPRLLSLLNHVTVFVTGGVMLGVGLISVAITLVSSAITGWERPFPEAYWWSLGVLIAGCMLSLAANIADFRLMVAAERAQGRS